MGEIKKIIESLLAGYKVPKSGLSSLGCSHPNFNDF